jgi:hypothetical protein
MEKNTSHHGNLYEYTIVDKKNEISLWNGHTSQYTCFNVVSTIYYYTIIY